MEMKNFVDNVELQHTNDNNAQNEKLGSKIIWRNLNVYAKLNSNDFFKRDKSVLKPIINNCNGLVESGTLLALMGSSGAGKSTLMSALAYHNARKFYQTWAREKKFNNILFWLFE